MKKDTPRQKGFSLVELLIVVTIIGIIAAIGVPNLMASRRTANEGSAVSSLRVLVGAQLVYRASSGTSNFAPNLADLHNLHTIDTQLASGTKSGYTFTCQRLPDVPGYPERFDATATPMAYGTVMASGNFSFYTSEAGVIYRQQAGAPPTADPLTRSVSNGEPIN